MKIARYLTVIPLALVLSVGCSDSNDPDVVTIEDFAGSWAASRFQITDPSGQVLAAPVDLIQDALGSLLIVVTSNGSFTGTFKPTAISPSTSVAGTISLSGTTLTIDFSEGLDDAIAGPYALSGNELTVTGTNLTFEWEGQTINGASVILVMNR